MIMETNMDPGGVHPAGDSTGLLAEFGGWLGRERGLSPVSVQCYSKQSKAFLAWIGGGGGGGRPGAGQGAPLSGGSGAGRGTARGGGRGEALRGVPSVP